MFQKIVSNLPYNPSSLNQLAFYGKRLKKEESIRRIGLFFLALSMLVQLFAAMVPAEKSLAASPENDVITGGVQSIDDLKNRYFAQADVKALYNRFGIDGNDLNLKSGVKNRKFSFKTEGAKGARTVGRKNFEDTKDHNLGDGQFAGSSFYSRSASEWKGSAPAYYFGKKKGTDGNTYEIWILKDCGNIAYRKVEGPKPKKETKKKTTITTEEKTETVIPVVACTRLSADKTTGKKSISVRFTGHYSASEPDLIDAFTFDFGDGNTIRNGGAVIDHVYTNDSLKSKTYTAIMTVNSTLGDKTSAACKKSIRLLPEVCSKNPSVKPDDIKCGVCQYNPNFTPDDERCKPTPVCENNPKLKPTDANCKCKDNPEITADDIACLPPGKLKKAQNITQSLTPEQTVNKAAKSGDIIEYSLITTNTNSVARNNYDISDNISDILSYADLDQASVARSGGKLSADKKSVIWANQTIPANGELIRTFRVNVKDKIPSTNNPNATSTDFDCKMQNGYGNELSIDVDCPIIKDIETLPNTGPGTTVAFAFFITMVSGYFFARSRLLAKEIAMIKKSYQ